MLIIRNLKYNSKIYLKNIYIYFTNNIYFILINISRSNP